MHLLLFLAQLIMSAQFSSATPRAHPPVTAGHPFIAAFRTEGHSPPQLIDGQMYRDSSGRTRVDYKLPTGEVRFIDDVSTRTGFVIDIGSKSHETDHYEPIHRWIFSNVDPVFTEEHRQILGVDCVRVSLRPPRGAHGDLGDAWISKPLGIVMKDQNPSQGWKWEVTEIEFREPDPGTFQVPAGFREMDR